MLTLEISARLKQKVNISQTGRVVFPRKAGAESISLLVHGKCTKDWGRECMGRDAIWDLNQSKLIKGRRGNYYI